MYERLTYLMLLEKAKPMLCLDISVRSTGWILWDGKTVHYGTWTLETDNNRKRRVEFGNFLEALLKQYKVDLIVLEDVIAGCNFKTTRILTELNIMVEVLMDYGRIPDIPVFRKDNKQWKSDLRQLSQAKTEVKGVDDKAMIRYHLGTLDFNPDVAQDIYDAMGIGLSYVYGEIKGTNKSSTEVKVHKLHTDLSKGYKKVQYADKETMLAKVNAAISRSKKPREYRYIEYDTKYRNLLVQFSSLIESEGTDEHIYCIHAPLNKIGSMFITAGFDLSADDVYFTAALR